ncbi:unnamed protein product [Ectocarpus sp. CCAP 1310/34]|nr:unnamed protein product [Ectocarpus sp. CCAP 1310/34]
MEDPAAQQRALAEGNKRVMQEAFLMKRATDASDTKSAFTHAGNMLKELKTTQLSPRNYYELYMKVLDELRHLEDFFTSQNRQARQPMVGLYEQAQACTMVLPRLYLLNTVGACYILSQEAPARDILKDLLEMTKGVQHPMRGLFLRNYFSHVTRDKLPDAGSPYEGDGGSVDDSVEFVLENFVEANKLWVRMHGQKGPSKDKKRRERERKDLRLLVGTNLVRLSQLEGVDGAKYKTDILPPVLEQVVGCKDTIAQSYLMDCLIQVFPDEFHLASLEAFLDGVCRLKEKVRVRPVLESLMERIGNYVEEHPDALPKDVDAFRLLNDCVTRLVSERPKLELSEIILMQVALLQFASQCYPGRLEYINHCIGVCGRAMVSRGFEPLTGGRPARRELPLECIEALLRLLSIPLKSLGLGVLSLAEYIDLLHFLPWESQKQVSLELLRSVLSKESALSDLDCVDRLLGMIAPILKDPPNGERGDGDAAMQAAQEEERRLVARVVHLMRNEDTDCYFRMLVVARRHLGQGSPSQVQYTLVPLVFRALGLARTIRAAEVADEEQAAAAETAAAAAAAATAKAEAEARAAADAAEGGANGGSGGGADDNGDAANGGEDGKEGEGGGDETEAAAAPAEGDEDSGETVAAAAAAGESPATGAEGAVDDAGAFPPVPPAAAVARPRQFSSRKVYQFLHEIVTAMAPLHPWVSLSLFLQCAIGADRTGFKAIAYEFFSQAFILYEDELSDSKAQVRALVSMAGTLLSCEGFDPVDYDALATKTAQYAAKLLKKPDQCRMVTLCSHLFWSPDEAAPGRRDARRVLECLQRSLKIADVCIAGGMNAQLFIEILNHYIFFFEADNPEIAGRYISGLVALIHEHVDSLDPSDARTEMERYFNNTLDHIRRKKEQADLPESLREKFASVTI